MVNNLQLLDKIMKFSLDNPEAKFSFSDRLCRENGWSVDYANKVINEYKKFIYMSVITGKSLTPSDEVDQAWHLHLIYSHSYWVDFCQNTLDGFKLHHGPTKGGNLEAKRYNEQYLYTLEVYNTLFGIQPPSDVWPSVEKRFQPMEFKRIDLRKNFVLNKRNVFEYMLTYLLPLFGVITMMLMSGKPVKEEEDNTILWIIGIIVGAFLLRGIYRYLNRDDRKSSRSSSSSSSSSSSTGCSVGSSFFGCGSSGCGSSSSGCGSSGCGSSCGGGCGGCGS